MKALIEGFDKNGERWLLLVFYAFVVTVIFVEVIRRFVFQYSSIWGEETARYAFIYLVWIGAAAAVKDRAHIRIDIIFKFLPDKAIAILYVLGDVITLIFACAALYWSLESVGTSIRFRCCDPRSAYQSGLVHVCGSVWVFTHTYTAGAVHSSRYFGYPRGSSSIYRTEIVRVA